MLTQPLGRILFAAALLTAGVAGIAAFWAAWPRTPDTSPLAALFALVWSGTHLIAAFLTWRGSRLAAPAFIAAVGLLLVLLSRLFPGGRMFLLASFLGTLVFGLLGYRYLRRVRQPAA